MPVVLHIVTTPDDTLAAGMIAKQQEQPGAQVEVVDLTAPQPDFARLLEAIFAADSIAVW